MNGARTTTSVLFLVAFPLSLSAQAAQLEALVSAPAAEVATSYRNVRQWIQLLRLAEMGMNVVMGGRTVNADNVAAVRAELTERIALLRAAVAQRGRAELAGTYRAQANRACGRIPSFWAQGVREHVIRDVTLAQDAGEIRLAQDVVLKGESRRVEITGVIVDSAIAFTDPLNSDFGFVGELSAGTIVVRPEVEAILAAWPAWVEPPSREHLAECAVRLRPSG